MNKLVPAGAVEQLLLGLFGGHVACKSKLQLGSGVRDAGWHAWAQLVRSERV